MTRAWGPPDISVPSLARVWDDLLSGKNAFQVDRDAVGELLVYADDWRPDDVTPMTSPEHTLLCAGIGRKP